MEVVQKLAMSVLPSSSGYASTLLIAAGSDLQSAPLNFGSVNCSIIYANKISTIPFYAKDRFYPTPKSELKTIFKTS
jgi:hypothetical protein